MGLKEFLDAGRMVMGSSFENKVKPLGSMSDSTQRRLGYADKDGLWTDRGYDRATSADYKRLEQSRISRMKSEK